MSTATYERLVERGCLCGTDHPQDCPLHKAGDNRGLAAFYKAGMPLAFPSPMSCGKCGAEGLSYPTPDRDDPAGGGLICPNCSTAAVESFLRFRVERSGLYKLNGRSVFGVARPGPVRDMQALLNRGTPEQQVECMDALRDGWHATEDGSDWTCDFALGDDGRLTMSAGRPPSFALALFFDYGNHMRGESTALLWDAEQERAAA